MDALKCTFLVGVVADHVRLPQSLTSDVSRSGWLSSSSLRRSHSGHQEVCLRAQCCACREFVRCRDPNCESHDRPLNPTQEQHRAKGHACRLHHRHHGGCSTGLGTAQPTGRDLVAREPRQAGHRLGSLACVGSITPRHAGAHPAVLTRRATCTSAAATAVGIAVRSQSAPPTM